MHSTRSEQYSVEKLHMLLLTLGCVLFGITDAITSTRVVGPLGPRMCREKCQNTEGCAGIDFSPVHLTCTMIFHNPQQKQNKDQKQKYYGVQAKVSDPFENCIGCHRCQSHNGYVTQSCVTTYDLPAPVRYGVSLSYLRDPISVCTPVRHLPIARGPLSSRNVSVPLSSHSKGSAVF